MTKSAIKKANKLARIERKQQQKLKAKEKAQAQQTVSTEPASVPQSKSQDVVKAEEVEVEQPPVSPPPAPVPAPLPLADPVKEEVKTNGAAAVVASKDLPKEVPKDLPPPPPQQPPAVEKAVPKPPSPPRVPEVEVRRPTPPKSNGTNGATTVDAENVKKRQNVLERTVWTFIMIGGFIGELCAIPSSSSTNSPSSRSLTSWSWVHGPARNVVSNTGIQGDYHSILSQEGGTRIS